MYFDEFPGDVDQPKFMNMPKTFVPTNRDNPYVTLSIKKQDLFLSGTPPDVLQFAVRIFLFDDNDLIAFAEIHYKLENGKVLEGESWMTLTTTNNSCEYDLPSGDEMVETFSFRSTTNSDGLSVAFNCPETANDYDYDDITHFNKVHVDFILPMNFTELPSYIAVKYFFQFQPG